MATISSALDMPTQTSLRMPPGRRSRPDHFHRGHDAEFERLTSVIDDMRARPGEYVSVATLESASGCGSNRLAKICRRHYHDTPIALLERARAEAATRALIGTDRRLRDIGRDAGYESNTLFDDQFHRLTGLSPRRYRALRDRSRFTVDLPDDFRPDDCLCYLGRDPESLTEQVRGKTLRRALLIDGKSAILELTLRTRRVDCRLESKRKISPAGMAAAHRLVHRLLGLGIDPARFELRVRRRRRMGRLVRRRPGLRIPQTASVYEGLVWAIIGQQINLPFALTLRRRVIELAGEPRIDGMIPHPSAPAIARLDYSDLTGRQFSGRKAEYLIDTSRMIAAGELAPESFRLEPVTRVERRLLTIRGFGPWSTHYLMMRSCGFADCVPVGDSGLATALERAYQLKSRPGADATHKLMAPFAPHRSLATFHFWRSLGDPA